MLHGLYKTINRGYHYLRAVRAGGPNYLIAFVTARCNLRCPHCFYLDEIEAAAKHRELTVDEYERISRNLPALIQLTCTGGETFLREDIDEIVWAFYRNSGTRFITLTTAGTLVDQTVKKVEEISRRCRNAVIKIPMSLDGVGPVHDKARGRLGTWERTMACYKGLRKLADSRDNVRLDITTVLSKLNEDHIYETIEFVKHKMKIENHTINFPRGAIRDPGRIVPDEIKYQDLVDKTFDRRKRGYEFPLTSRVFVRIREVAESVVVYTQHHGDLPFVCTAGERFIELSEYGDVFPCEVLDTLIKNGQAHPRGAFDTCTMGNVRDHGYDIRRVMDHECGMKVRQFIQGKGCACTFECAIAATIAFEPSNFRWMLRPPPRSANGPPLKGL